MAGVRADERRIPSDDGPAAETSASYISAMCPRNDNHIDWTAAAIPEGERVAPSLAPNRKPATAAPRTRHDVMNTLLGANDLAAMDVGGGDPYNATGRYFRR